MTLEEAEDTKGHALAIVLVVAGLLLGIVVGGLGMYWYTQPTTMQKMIGIHDHMKSAEVRYIWRQVYCECEKKK